MVIAAFGLGLFVGLLRDPTEGRGFRYSNRWLEYRFVDVEDPFPRRDTVKAIEAEMIYPVEVERFSIRQPHWDSLFASLLPAQPRSNEPKPSAPTRTMVGGLNIATNDGKIVNVLLLVGDAVGGIFIIDGENAGEYRGGSTAAVRDVILHAYAEFPADFPEL